MLYSSSIKWDNVSSIVQIRTLRNGYQRVYEKGLKSQNWVEMREKDRYLHFEEVQQVLKTLMEEFLEGQKDPSQVMSTTKEPLLIKAKQLQRFLILLFYTSLPPSRALEIRTLKYNTSLQFRKTTNTWWLVLSEFKTVRAKGIDSMELDPTSQKVLITYLELFFNLYRRHLIDNWWEKKRKNNLQLREKEVEDEGFLFVPPGKTKDQGFTESAWSAMMCKLFKEKTGMSVTINTLRSSFITYFYSNEASENLNLRESMANGMRHSLQEAQRTYDRRYFTKSNLSLFLSHFIDSFFHRTSHEKKRKAVNWCGNNTMRWLGGEETPLPPEPKVIKKGPTPQHQYDDNEPYTHSPNLGDVVAVPFKKEDSTPSFWLGKCLRVNNEDSTLLLGWFERLSDENKYKMKIGASWSEVCSCLYRSKKKMKNVLYLSQLTFTYFRT